MSNEEHQGKVFSLKPATDPDTLSILDARRRALAEPNERLNRSMKACFCEILDRALHPVFFDSKGVVTISDTVLAQVFGVSNRTIYTWKRKLEDSGYVWLTQKWKSNMWPITTYHLTCLHKPRRDEKTDADGTYGGGRLRSSPVSPGLGARKPGQPQLALPGSRQSPPDTKSEEMQGTSGQTGKTLRPKPEENFGSEPKAASGGSRRNDRAGAEENFGSEPKSASGESRSQLRPTPEADCRHIETQKQLESPLESPTRLGNRPQSDQVGPIIKARRKPSDDENDFMATCLAVFGTKEMRQGGPTGNGNGGLWRTLYRQDAEYAWKVMQETRTAKLERPGTIKKGLPQFAMDLWAKRRLGPREEAAR